jgi:signal transduction histidine kinase
MAAWALAIVGPTSITLGSRLLGSYVPPASALFSILLVVVIGALVGGWRPALTAVAIGLLAQEVVFSFPYGSLNNHEPAQLSVLVAFGVIGAVVGILVDDLSRLTEEQAALRRIAILVATEAPIDTLLSAVAREVGQLLRADCAVLGRYEPDSSMTVAADWSRAGLAFPAGARWSLDGETVWKVVAEAGSPARIHCTHDGSGPDAGAAGKTSSHSGVGMTITVDGRAWGMIIAVSTIEQSLPANTEARLVGFTDLLATAIANAERRADLARLAEEQAALQRVAVLVARATPQGELFSSVTEEVGRLLRVGLTMMSRYEPDGTVTIIAGWSRVGDRIPVGMRLGLGGTNLSAIVAQTRSPARMDSYNDASGEIGPLVREMELSSGVGAPIIVEGGLWGVMIAASTGKEQLAPDSEARLASFTDLVATAIANAESRGALVASRARIVGAADQARRRIERDLHDGAQQRLVSLGLELRAAQTMVPPELEELQRELSHVVEGFTSVLDELREMARGIHPAILAEGGLGPALKALQRRSPIPVELSVRSVARLPERVEVAMYYVVAETLTNAAKHARASALKVDVEAASGILRLCVRDDGVGGADPARGSGLVGLRDRVESLGGSIAVESPSGRGTAVTVALPISAVAE